MVSGTTNSAQRKWNTIITPKNPKIAHGGTLSAAIGKVSATSAAKNQCVKLPRACPCARCHCTGEKAYEIMKSVMKAQLEYIRCGDSVTI